MRAGQRCGRGYDFVQESSISLLHPGDIQAELGPRRPDVKAGPPFCVGSQFIRSDQEDDRRVVTLRAGDGADCKGALFDEGVVFVAAMLGVDDANAIRWADGRLKMLAESFAKGVVTLVEHEDVAGQHFLLNDERPNRFAKAIDLGIAKWVGGDERQRALPRGEVDIIAVVGFTDQPTLFEAGDIGEFSGTDFLSLGRKRADQYVESETSVSVVFRRH